MTDEERTSLEAELDRLRANCGDLKAERLDVLAKLSQPNQAGFDGGSLAGAVAAELTQWREAYEGQREELNVYRSRLQIPLADPDDVKPDQVVVDPASKRVYVSVWMQDSCLLAYLREEYIVDKDLMEAEFPFDSNECKLRDGWSVIRVSAAMFAVTRAELTEWSRLAKMDVSDAYKKWVGECSECGADSAIDECHKHFCAIGMAESQEASDIGAAKLAEARTALRAALNWLDLPAGGEAIYARKDLPACVQKLRALLPQTGNAESTGPYMIPTTRCQHASPSCAECVSAAYDMAKAALREPETPDAVIVEDGGGPVGPDAVTLTFRRGPMPPETCEGCGLPEHDGVCLDHAVDECNRLREKCDRILDTQDARHAYRAEMLNVERERGAELERALIVLVPVARTFYSYWKEQLVDGPAASVLIRYEQPEWNVMSDALGMGMAALPIDLKADERSIEYQKGFAKAFEDPPQVIEDNRTLLTDCEPLPGWTSDGDGGPETGGAPSPRSDEMEAALNEAWKHLRAKGKIGAEKALVRIEGTLRAALGIPFGEDGPLREGGGIDNGEG